MKIKYTFICAIFLMGWGVVTPHFQIPDEFAHHDRLASLLSGDFFGSTKSADSRYLNPVAEYAGYNALPFQAANGMRPLMTSQVKSLQNKSHESSQVEIKNCCATNYPPLFYALISIPSMIAYGFDISPFDQYWLVRLSVILVVSVLWAFAFDVARILSLHYFVLVGLTTPMVAYMSTGINPDAIFFPLSVLFILAVVERLNYNSQRCWHFFVPLALPLTKIFGLFLILSLSLTFILMALINKRNFKITDAVVLTAPGLISGSIWYGITGVAHSSGAKPESFYGVIDLFYYYKNFDWLWLVKSTYGIFGWLDAPLPNYAYILALILLSIAFGNGISRIQIFKKKLYFMADNNAASILLVTALCYACAIFIVDAYLSRFDGRVIQGRYLLPSFFVCVWFINYYRGWTNILLAAWISISCVGISTVFERYYAGNLKVLIMNLPRTEVTHVSPQSNGSLPILFSLPNGIRVDPTRGGNVDSISAVGYHDYIVRGWYDATRFPVPLSGLVVISKGTELLSANSRRISRLDLKNLHQDLTHNGFEIQLTGFRLDKAVKPIICLYALKGEVAELLNNNFSTDGC